MYCPKCGKANFDSARFCVFCGYSLPKLNKPSISLKCQSRKERKPNIPAIVFGSLLPFTSLLPFVVEKKSMSRWYDDYRKVNHSFASLSPFWILLVVIAIVVIMFASLNIRLPVILGGCVAALTPVFYIGYEIYELYERYRKIGMSNRDMKDFLKHIDSETLGQLMGLDRVDISYGGVVLILCAIGIIISGAVWMNGIIINKA